MTANDIPEVIDLLRRFPAVAYCDWENEELLAQILTQSPASSFVAHDGTRVIGAIISGTMGMRATINHLAVDQEYRSQGIGDALVAHALASFRAAGIHRVFLFVLRDQPGARRFWKKNRFVEIVGEVTMERDI
jgi:ribosomal protein S18 acetylase RimI-like enzyme